MEIKGIQVDVRVNKVKEITEEVDDSIISKEIQLVNERKKQEEYNAKITKEMRKMAIERLKQKGELPQDYEA